MRVSSIINGRKRREEKRKKGLCIYSGCQNKRGETQKCEYHRKMQLEINKRYYKRNL